MKQQFSCFLEDAYEFLSPQVVNSFMIKKKKSQYRTRKIKKQSQTLSFARSFGQGLNPNGISWYEFGARMSLLIYLYIHYFLKVNYI